MLLRLSSDQVSRYWDDIRAALVAGVPTLAKVDQEGINTFLEGLLQGRLHAWIIYSKDVETIKILALAVTTIWKDLGTGARSLLIYALYGYSFVPEETWNADLQTLRKFAKTEGCQNIVAFTRVPRIITIAEALGGNTETRLITLEV